MTAEPADDAPAPVGQPEPLRPLARALELFKRFDEGGIDYCHYKSNEHLLEGLAGVTDLDILVRKSQSRAAQRALMDAGFKRFTGNFSAAYPSVEDYLGFDDATGKLIHAHTYYALAVGEKHLKSYQLGFDGAVLDSRVLDADTGVATADPNYEMLLLLVRYGLKARWRDSFGALLGKHVFDADAKVEHEWLRQRIELDVLRRITDEQLGPAAAEMVHELVERVPTLGQLSAFRSRAGKALSRYRSYGRVEAVPARLWRELTWWLGGLNRRFLHWPLPLRRTHPAGGQIIAFLGPDGSGKSTVGKEIKRWLGWKLDVYPLYFGSGDGSSSLLRWPLKALIRARANRRGRSGEGGGSAGAAADTSAEDGDEAKGGHEADGAPRRISPIWVLWAILLTWEKQSKMRMAVRARNKGMTVVCDRYPQVQVMGFNDGPLLAPWLDSGFLPKRWLARWELAAYRTLTLTAPDLVIKLDVTPEAGLARSPDTGPGEIERRRNAVSAMDYGPGSRTVLIDGMRPLPEVVLETKRAIWDVL